MNATFQPKSREVSYKAPLRIFRCVLTAEGHRNICYRSEDGTVGVEAGKALALEGRHNQENNVLLMDHKWYLEKKAGSWVFLGLGSMVF